MGVPRSIRHVPPPNTSPAPLVDFTNPRPAPQVMLSLVVDIKNNKKRSGRDSGPPAVLPPPVHAWLKSSGTADVCLRNITWPKLLRPNKKVCAG